MKTSMHIGTLILSDGVRELHRFGKYSGGLGVIQSRVLPVIANSLAAPDGTRRRRGNAHGLLLDEAAASAMRIMADKDFAPSFRIMAAR